MTQKERQVLQIIEADPMVTPRDIARRLDLTREEVSGLIASLMDRGCIAGRGFVLKRPSYAVVVGGVNIDVGGTASGPLVAGDSNPGRVRLSLGGVGRNIAHNLALLGTDVRMLTAFGDDLHGEQAAASFARLGIDGTHALRVPGGNTSTYLYLTDARGEMALAVSDMSVCEKITPGYLASNFSLLHNAQVVVTDTNIPQESLRFLADNCTRPIFCDPVSTAKARKLLPILPRIHTLKPNRMEAELLTGMEIHGGEDAKAAAKKLLDLGVHRVFLSLGADGLCAAQGDRCLLMENLPGRMVNTTGCGDAFMAAIVWAWLEALDLEETALAGLAAASIAMEAPETINPMLNVPALRSRMNQR